MGDIFCKEFKMKSFWVQLVVLSAIAVAIALANPVPGEDGLIGMTGPKEYSSSKYSDCDVGQMCGDGAAYAIGDCLRSFCFCGAVPQTYYGRWEIDQCPEGKVWSDKPRPAYHYGGCYDPSEVKECHKKQ